MTLVPELRLELYDAAQRHASRGANGWPQWLKMRRARMLIASGGLALCTIVVAVVLLLAAISSPSPAYALTRNSDGSFTLKMYTLSRGIPQLNAKLRALGIGFTVVPMVNGCPYWAPSYPVNGQDTITLRAHQDVRPGQQGFIAAMQFRDGVVSYAQGGLPKGDIPPCFGNDPVIIWPARTEFVNPNPGPATSRSGPPSGSGG